LRTAVASTQSQAYAYTTIRYTDGSTTPGLAVGGPLAVPGVGAYELYYLFPLDQVQQTLDLVQRPLAIVGLVLVLLPGAIAWLATRGDFDPATARAAELLQTQLDRFEALLTDLLEISRFDAGAAVLEPEPVDVRDVVRRVVEAAEPLAERRETRIRTRLPTVP